MILRKISHEKTWPLRHALLRPNQTLEDCKYPGDEQEFSFHLGLFDQESETLVCIVSFYAESCEHSSTQRQYRFRGMATHPDYRGRGMASQLLQEGIEQLKLMNVEFLWCNARTNALSFYEKLGFQIFSDEFEIAGIGPHKVMALSLV